MTIEQTHLDRIKSIAVKQYPIIGVPLCDEIARLEREIQRLLKLLPDEPELNEHGYEVGSDEARDARSYRC